MSTAWNSYIAVKTADILADKLKEANMWQLYLDIELPELEKPNDTNIDNCNKK